MFLSPSAFSPTSPSISGLFALSMILLNTVMVYLGRYRMSFFMFSLLVQRGSHHHHHHRVDDTSRYKNPHDESTRHPSSTPSTASPNTTRTIAWVSHDAPSRRGRRNYPRIIHNLTYTSCQHHPLTPSPHQNSAEVKVSARL